MTAPSLLSLFLAFGCFLVETAAQPGPLTTTPTTAPSSVWQPPVPPVGGNGITLTISPPSSSLAAGTPVNLTCVFQVLPDTNDIFFSLNSGYGKQNIVQVSTEYMAAAMEASLRSRLVVYLLDDGVSLQFQYSYVTSADTGVYQCSVGGSAISSNTLSLTVTGDFQSPNYVTPGSLPEFSNYPVTQNSGVNVPLIIAVSIGVACLLVSTVLLVLRLKYRDRFLRMSRSRGQQPPTYQNTVGMSASAGVTNPVYVVDAEQLPSYNDALKISDEKVFMPPSYIDVVSGQAPTTSTAADATPVHGASAAAYGQAPQQNLKSEFNV